MGDNKNFIVIVSKNYQQLGDLKINDIQNEDVFTLLFAPLNNGNLIEIFKSKIDDEGLFTWKKTQ